MKASSSTQPALAGSSPVAATPSSQEVPATPRRELAKGSTSVPPATIGQAAQRPHRHDVCATLCDEASRTLTAARHRSYDRQSHLSGSITRFWRVAAWVCFIGVASFVAQVAYSQCCGDGTDGGGNNDNGNDTGTADCPPVMICFGWDLGTGGAPVGTQVVTTITLPPSISGPPAPPTYAPAGATGQGSLFVPPGATVSMEFYPPNTVNGTVHLWECSTPPCNVQYISAETSITAPDHCIEGGEEGEGTSGLDDNEGPKEGGDGNGSGGGADDDTPYEFSMGIGDLHPGHPAGQIDYTPADLTLNYINATAIWCERLRAWIERILTQQTTPGQSPRPRL